MKKSSTAQRLIQGSRTINRMRAEIEELIDIIVGFLKQTDVVRENNWRKELETSTCVWTISRFPHRDKPVLVVAIRCTRKNSGRLIFSNLPKEYRPKVDTVAMLHASLSELIDLLAREFSELENAWEPLIAASHIPDEQILTS